MCDHFLFFLNRRFREEVNLAAGRQLVAIRSMSDTEFVSYKELVRDELAKDKTLSDEEWVRLIGIKIAAGIPESRKRAVSTLLRTLTLESGYFCQFNLASVLRDWLEDEAAKMTAFHMQHFSRRCAMRCRATWEQVCDSF